MYSSVGNVYRVPSYWAAMAVFNQRGPVRSAKWSANQRPLRKTDYHYRIEHHAFEDLDYYDVILYRTIMGRLHKPVTIDGKVHERRQYMGHDSITSTAFMDHVLGVRAVSPWTALSGEEVTLPVYSRAMPGSDFSADITFVDNLLDVQQSAHTRHYKHVSSKDDKDKRAHIKQVLDNYVTLALMRLPEFEASATVNARQGTPFANASGRNYEYSAALNSMMQGSETQAEIEAFFDLCQHAYNVLASKRAYADGQVAWYGGQKQSISADALDNPVTPADLKKSIHGTLVRVLEADVASHPVEVPQFLLWKECPKKQLSTWIK